MASQNPADLLASSFEKIKQAINVNIVMGEPLDTGLGMTVIPVSKVTYGFTSGEQKTVPTRPMRKAPVAASPWSRLPS